MAEDDVANYELLVGTYEAFVLGYKISPKSESGQYELVPSFTSRAHCGPVRSVQGIGKYVISGGSDEICKIYDLATRVEHGQLMHHEGTVSCLAGYKSFLLTASDDNTISVLTTGSWQVEKTLYKHQGGVTALAVHPTGKLAFSAAKDKKLITWNLVKARPAFITNIKGIAEFVVCSPDGTRYCVGIHRRVDIYSIESAGIEYTVDLKCRPNCLVFIDNNTVLIGGESPKVQIHSLIEKSLLHEFEAHETRVRCMLLIPRLSPPGEESGESQSVFTVATASSSDNKLKLWRVEQAKEFQVTCVGSVDTTCRITCLAYWHASMKTANKKRKKPKNIVTTQAGKSPEGPKKKIKFSSDHDNSKVSEESSKSKLVVEVESNTRVSRSPSGKKKKKKAETASAS